MGLFVFHPSVWGLAPEQTTLKAEAARRRFEHRGGYDVIHANFFMSGLVARHLKHMLGTPYVMTFHALGLVVHSRLGAWVAKLFDRLIRRVFRRTTRFVVDRLQLADRDPEKLARDLEHARHHTIDREIRTKLLVIEVEILLPLPLRPIRDFPRFQRFQRPAGLRRLVLRKLAVVREERRLDPLVQVLDEFQRRFAGPRHPLAQR